MSKAKIGSRPGDNGCPAAEPTPVGRTSGGILSGAPAVGYGTRVLRTALLVVVGSLAACARGEPPTYRAPGLVASVAPMPTPSASTTAPVDAGAADAPADAAPVDPGTLPQTRDRPPSQSPALGARAAALWDAIVKDDPQLAMPFFFPVTAYEQTKAVVKPAADWRWRLVKNYERDVHALHESLRRDLGRATFDGIDVPGERARWVDPGEEGNKTGYWRVYGAQLRYRVGDRTKTIGLSSLISWRGEWYVVHLTGFK
jgi:hypothetical protein